MGAGTYGGGGSLRKDTGGFLVLAREKANKINIHGMPSGPAKTH